MDTIGTQEFRLVTLGGFALLRRDAEANEGWTDSGLGEKPCALLAYLLWRGSDVPRAGLAELLWEGVENGRSRNSLRQALFRIRSVLGSGAVIETPNGIRLAAPLGVDPPELIRGDGAGERRGSTDGERLHSFGKSAVIRGRAFAAWCAQVRAEAVSSQAASESPDGALAGQRQDRDRSELRANAAAEWLSELWQLAVQGIPMSAWLARSQARMTGDALDTLARECRANGGRFARIPTMGPEYLPYALERDLAEVLGDLPGAAGILPEHHDAIGRVRVGQRAQPSLLSAAILDLMSAVAEDAPLMLYLEEPERYSVGALRGLVSGLTTQSACPALLVLAARDGTDPVSPLCLSMPGDQRAARPASRSGPMDRMHGGEATAG